MAANNQRFADLLQSYNAEEDQKVERNPNDSFFHMFRYCNLSIYVLFTCFNWLVVNLCYFGLVYNSTDLGQGLFLNFLLGAIVEAPAHVVSLFMVDYKGRKFIHGLYFILVIVATAVSTGVSLKLGDMKSVLLAMTMVAKFGAAGLMGTSYLWMTEIYPTSIRSTGLGVGAASARLGAIIPSYVITFGKHMHSDLGTALPYIVFCGASVLAFLCCLYLPETKGRDLPETVQEAHHFGRNPEYGYLRQEENFANYGAHLNR